MHIAVIVTNWDLLNLESLISKKKKRKKLEGGYFLQAIQVVL